MAIQCLNYSPILSKISEIHFLLYVELKCFFSWNTECFSTKQHRKYSLCHYISWTDSIKPSLLFLNFGYCICNGLFSYSDLFRDINLQLGRVAPLIVSPFIDIVLIILHFLVLSDCRVQHIFGIRVALNQGLGIVKDVASAIISHEQTQQNRAVVPCGDPKLSPRSSI